IDCLAPWNGGKSITDPVGGTNEIETVEDQVNSQFFTTTSTASGWTLADRQSGGNTGGIQALHASNFTFGMGANKAAVDVAGRFFIPAASDGGAACNASQSTIWSSTANNKLKHCDNAGSQVTVANLESAQSFTADQTFTTQTIVQT